MSWRTPGVPTLAVAPETVMHFSLYGSGSTLIHIRGGIPLAWPRGGGTRSLGGGPVVVRRGHAKTRVLLAGHDFSGKREYPIGAFYLSFRFVETKQFSNCNILFSSNFC